MRDYLDALHEDAEKNPEQRAQELSRRELPKRFYQRAEHVEIDGGNSLPFTWMDVR